MPVHLFVSGRQAPNVTDSHRPPVDSMNDEQFQSQVISLNGIPDEIRAVPDLMAYILPALKADFIAVDRWAHAPVAPLSVPITALVGRDDPTATAESAQAWQQHTRSNFTVRHYRGDHFFIRNSERQVLETIGRTLSPYLGDM